MALNRDGLKIWFWLLPSEKKFPKGAELLIKEKIKYRRMIRGVIIFPDETGIKLFPNTT